METEESTPLTGADMKEKMDAFDNSVVRLEELRNYYFPYGIPHPELLHCISTVKNRSEDIISILARRNEIMYNNISTAMQAAKEENTQQIAMNPSKFVEVSNDIVANLGSVLEKLRQVKSVLVEHGRHDHPLCTTVIKLVTELIKKHAQKSLIVSLQPCEEVKTEARFLTKSPENSTADSEATNSRNRKRAKRNVPSSTASSMEICFLAGEYFGVSPTTTTASACIVDENTCQNIYQRLWAVNSVDIKKHGTLTYDTARFEVKRKNNCITAAFTNAMLTNFEHVGKEVNKELVTDRKFAVLFTIHFAYKDIDIEVHSLSLPIAIHNAWSQRVKCWKHIRCYNAFSQVNGVPFDLPKDVKSNKVIKMFENCFKSWFGDVWTDEYNTFFDGMLSRTAVYPTKDAIRVSSLFKTKGAVHKRVSDMDWFYEGSKLIRDFLQDACMQGYVLAFVTRDQSKKLLKETPGVKAGTFLLRLDISTVGGICIDWLHSDRKVYTLEKTLTRDDLTTQSIVKILTLDNLCYSWNVKRKLCVDESVAFREYYRLAQEASVMVQAGHEEYSGLKIKYELDNPTIPAFIPEASQVPLHQGQRNLNLNQRSTDNRLPVHQTAVGGTTLNGTEGQMSTYVSSEAAMTHGAMAATSVQRNFGAASTHGGGISTISMPMDQQHTQFLQTPIFQGEGFTSAMASQSHNSGSLMDSHMFSEIGYPVSAPAVTDSQVKTGNFPIPSSSHNAEVNYPYQLAHGNIAQNMDTTVMSGSGTLGVYSQSFSMGHPQIFPNHSSDFGLSRALVPSPSVNIDRKFMAERSQNMETILPVSTHIMSGPSGHLNIQQNFNATGNSFRDDEDTFNSIRWTPEELKMLDEFYEQMTRPDGHLAMDTNALNGEVTNPASDRDRMET